MSIDASYTGGMLQTPPVTFDGDRLELNIEAAAMGEVRVELQDQEGRTINGFAAADCDRIMSNDVAHRVHWHGSDDIGLCAAGRCDYSSRCVRLSCTPFSL